MPTLRLSLKEDVSEKTKKASLSFGGFVTSMNQGLQLIQNVGGRAFRALDQVFETAGKAEQLSSGFVSLSGGVGEADANLKAITDALHGTVSEMEAMEIANTAMSFGLVNSAEDLGELANIGAVLAQSLGIDAAKGVGDLTLALSRSSPMILDNLGISLKLSTAYAAEAANLGKLVSELTDAEKKQAFFNEALRLGREKVEKLGGFVVNASTKYQILTARAKDTRVEFSKMLAEAFEPMLDSLVELSEIDPKFIAAEVSEAIRQVGDALGYTNDRFNAVTTGTGRVETGLLAMLNPIDAVTGLVSLSAEAAREAAGAADSVAEAMRREKAIIQRVNEALGTNIEFYDDATAALRESRKEVNEYEDSLFDLEDELKEIKKGMMKLVSAEEMMDKITAELTGSMKLLGLSVKDTIEGQKKAEEDFRKSFQMVKESGKFTAEQLKDAWDEFFDVVEEGSGSMAVEVIGDHTKLVSQIQELMGPGMFDEEQAAVATWIDRETAELLARQEEIMGPIHDAVQGGLEGGFGDVDMDDFGNQLQEETRVSVAQAFQDPDLRRQLAEAFGIALDQSIKGTDASLGSKQDLSARDQKKIDNLLLTTNGNIAQTLQGVLNALAAGDLSFVKNAIAGTQSNLAMSRKYGNSSKDREFRAAQGATLDGMHKILDIFGVKIPGFARGGVGDFGGGSLVKLHQSEAIIPLDESGDRISQAIMGGSVVDVLRELVVETRAQTAAVVENLRGVSADVREQGGGESGGVSAARQRQRRERAAGVGLDPAMAVL